MGAHRKSIVKETVDRLGSKMAVGQSRYAANKAIRQEQSKAWPVSDGEIQSFKTRSVYQEHSGYHGGGARAPSRVSEQDRRGNGKNEHDAVAPPKCVLFVGERLYFGCLPTLPLDLQVAIVCTIWQ